MVGLSGVIKSGILGGFLTGMVFFSVIRFVEKAEKYDEVLSYKKIFILSIACSLIFTIVFILLFYLGVYEYLF